MIKVVIKNTNGSISIITPIIDLETVLKKDIPAGADYKLISEELIPLDRTFRQAWEIDNENIVINITKAQDIHKDYLRKLRKPILEKLDISYMKALEAKDEKAMADIGVQKQELRDVTTLTMPEEISQLKDFIPDILLL